MAVTEITNARHGCRETVDCYVPIPPNLSHTGRFRWDYKPVDRCLAPIIRLFNAAGKYTSACCCGHGMVPGDILFHDGESIGIPKCERINAAP